MFKKTVPLALVVLAGCVGLAPTTQKPDTVHSLSGNPTDQNAQKSSSTPAPTQTPKITPTPSPTPSPTPLPNTVLRAEFYPVDGVPGLEVRNLNQTYLGKRQIVSGDFFGLAQTASGDMYVQVGIPTDSTPVLCPTCDKNLSRYSHYAVFKKTKEEGEFKFVAMGKKEVLGKDSWDTEGKIYFKYSRYDFSLSGFAQAASLSVVPLVKSVDITTKEIRFDTAVWPQNTGPLTLSDVGGGDFFGQDIDQYQKENNVPGRPCLTMECETERALAVARERTAFTGAVAYFIGRGRITYPNDYSGLWGASANTTIFRVSASGVREIVGKRIAAYFANPSFFQIIYNVAYSRADGKLYLLALPPGSGIELYRVSESALVP